jgi:hypothetical protein
VGTVSHPSNNALTATTGTFSDAVTINDGDAGSVTANTVADELVVESSGAGGMSILTPDASDANLFLGGPGANAGAIVRWNDDSNLMSIGTNNSGGTMALKIGGFTDALTIDANGHISKPLQSAFFAQPSSQQANIALTGETIAFGTEIFDQNGDFSSNTFTAPITGRYQLQVMVRADNVDSAANFCRIVIQTSNRNHIAGMIDPAVLSSDPGEWNFVGVVLTDMDANDTAIITWSQSGGAAQTDIETDTFFSGYLVA